MGFIFRVYSYEGSGNIGRIHRHSRGGIQVSKRSRKPSNKAFMGVHVLDFASLCADLFSDHISDHDFVKKDWPEIYKEAKKIEDSLYEFYQFAARKVFAEEDSK